jgi:hypothetical protein
MKKNSECPESVHLNGLSSLTLNNTKNLIITEMKQIYLLLEYWRLDDIAVRMAPGYKGYIAEAFRYFFNPSDIIETLQIQIRTEILLTDPDRKYKYKQFEFYYEHLLYALFAQSIHFIHYQDVCDDSFERNLTGKEKDTQIFSVYERLKNLIDVNNISRLKSTEDTLNLAITIWEEINARKSLSGTEKSWESAYLSAPDDFQLPDLKQKADRLVQAAALEMDKKAISVAHKDEIRALSGNATDKNYTLYNNRRVKVIVINSINRDMLHLDRYYFLNDIDIYANEKAVSEGILLGKQLAHKISFRNNLRQTHYARLRQGNIDRHLLHSLAWENEAIFYREKEESFPAVHFHISIDGSHSMKGNCFRKSIKTAVAIAQAGVLTKNIQVTISCRYHLTIDGERRPLLLIVYDSRQDKFEKIRQFFPYLNPAGSTPEGLCYSTIAGMMASNTGTAQFFINFYDGMPCFIIDDECCYEGKQAMEHVRNEVMNMKRKGIKVLSYFIISPAWKREEIKNAFEDCRYMYGSDAQMINVGDLSELARSLNKLVERG